MVPQRLFVRGAARLLAGACFAAVLALPATGQEFSAVPSWRPRSAVHNATWQSDHAMARMASRPRPTAILTPSTSTATRPTVGRYGRPWPTASELKSSSTIVREDLPAPSSPAAPEEIKGEVTAEAPPETFIQGPVEGPFLVEGPDIEWVPGEFHGDECCDTQMPCCPLLAGDWWRNIAIFGGVHAFKGPVDQGQNGNFGFHEGINAGFPLSYVLNMGAQVGAHFAHSDFSGSDLEDETRTQSFFTAGLFHRSDIGLQYGAVFDWLHDEYYVEQNLHQVRAEISCVNGCGRDFGVMAAISTADDHASETTATGTVMNFWNPVDQFALFYRVRFDSGGEGRIWGGTNADKDGIIGGEALVPISDAFALQAVANYLLPEESDGTGPNSGHANEAWGIAVNLVWYPGQRARTEMHNPFRPLFNVADNATMIIDRVAQ